MCARSSGQLVCVSRRASRTLTPSVNAANPTETSVGGSCRFGYQPGRRRQVIESLVTPIDRRRDIRTAAPVGSALVRSTRTCSAAAARLRLAFLSVFCAAFCNFGFLRALQLEFPSLVGWRMTSPRCRPLRFSASAEPDGTPASSSLSSRRVRRWTTAAVAIPSSQPKMAAARMIQESEARVS